MRVLLWHDGCVMEAESSLLARKLKYPLDPTVLAGDLELQRNWGLHGSHSLHCEGRAQAERAAAG